MDREAKITKHVLDTVMFIFTFLMIDLGVTGNTIHEYLGISISVLMMLHILLDYKWFTGVLKNFARANTKAKAMLITDIIIMVSYFVTIITGIWIGTEFIYPGTAYNPFIVAAHVLAGRLALVVMLIHLSLHFDRMIKNVKTRKAGYVIYGAFTLFMAIYLEEKLVTSYQWISAFSFG